MADFETKLRWLSERGNPVGAEELIERIEAEMAGDPLVVVAKRREGTAMTKTQQSPRTDQPNRYRGPAWALAAFVAVLALAATMYFTVAGDNGQVAEPTTVPTPTTVLTTAPNPTLLQDVGDRFMGPLGPGAYFADADGDPSTTTGVTLLIEGSGWMGSSAGVVRHPGDPSVSLHVHQIELRFGPHSPGCDRGGPNAEAAGSTAADLADGFASGGFTVLEAPAPISAFGRDGHHVIIEVPEGCDDAKGGQYDIFLYPGEVMEAWLFDIDGHIVMVEANWLVESSEEDLAELRAVIDTLVLTP